MNNCLRFLWSCLILISWQHPILGQDQSIRSLLIQADSLVYDEPDQSLSLSIRALDMAIDVANDSLRAEALYRKASAHWSKGDLSDALDDLNRAAVFAEYSVIPKLYANINRRIGTLYASVDDDSIALRYYKLSIPGYRSTQDSIGLVAIFNNIGNSFRDLKQFDSGEYFLKKAMTLMGDQESFIQPILNFNLGELYYMSGDLDQAEEYLEVCRVLSNARDDKRGIIRANQLLAEILLTRGEVASAQKNADLAMALALETNSKELIFFASGTLAKVLYTQGLYQEAFDMQKTFVTYGDSLQGSQHQNRLDLYNISKTQTELEVVKRESAINELHAQNFKIVIYGLVILVILVIALALVLNRNRKLTARANQSLSEKNRQIEQQREELKGLNDFKTKLLAIVSHDLKSPIQGLYGIVDLIERDLASPDELAAQMPRLRKRMQWNYEKVNELLQWSMADITKETRNYEPCALDACVASSIVDLSLEAQEKGIGFDVNIPEDLFVMGDGKIIKIVMRNILSNAIKFSEKGKSVSIGTKRLQDEVEVIVSDHGVGMSQKTLDELFDAKNESTFGTRGELGSGFGLIICRNLLQMIDSGIWAESQEGVGSKFHISLKVSTSPGQLVSN